MTLPNRATQVPQLHQNNPLLGPPKFGTYMYWSDAGDCDEPENYGYEQDEEQEYKGRGKNKYITGKDGSVMMNRKTTICRAWHDGFCDRDDQCGFAHGASELRRIEHDNGTYSGPPGCVDYMRGVCGKGERCSFNHNREVIKTRYEEEFGLDREMPVQMKQKCVQTYKGHIKGNSQDMI